MRGKKKRKFNLFKADPHCYWCGIEVKIYNVQRHQKHPDDEATVDHLVSRYYPEKRKNPEKNERRLVLSCRKCNMDRAEEEKKKIPIEEIRKMSKRHKQVHITNQGFFGNYKIICCACKKTLDETNISEKWVVV